MKKFNLTKDFLIKEYIQNKKTFRQIAKEVGCCFTTIGKCLKKNNIKSRTISEAGKGISRNKGNKRPDLSLLNKLRDNSGKKNPNYTHGETLKKHYCNEKGCDNEISYENYRIGNKRCSSCAKIGKRSPAFGVHLFGKLNHNWRGGISKEPYPFDWTKILKASIRTRDNHQCQICGKSTKANSRALDVHHIDYDKENLKPDNLISLCRGCHMQSNGNRDIYIEYFGILKNILKIN